MVDSEVVFDDQEPGEVVSDDLAPDIDPEDQDGERPRRRWLGLVAIIVLLLLLLCCIVTSVEVWVTGGPEQARFIARNIECLQCHTELIPDFSKASVHNPFMLKECTTCHTPHGKKIEVRTTEGPGKVWQRYRTFLQWLPLKWFFSLWDGVTGQTGVTGGRTKGTESTQVKGQTSYLVAPESQLCWTCHGSMGAKLNEEYPHQPFMAGRCTNCHDPHASDFRTLLTQAPNKICFTCHPMGEQLNKAQAHDPAKSGWCIDCHDPHASEYKGILVARQRELCFRCHPTVAGQAGMPVQHQPFLNDNCVYGCHEPHGSDSRPLLIQEEPPLCYRCHGEIEDQFRQPSSHPVGVTLTCASCHDPHAANYPALLNARNNSFCFQCHGDVKALYNKSRHVRTLCIRCHTPHGSMWKPMLRNSNPELCLECHDSYYYDQGKPGEKWRNRHPVRPIFFDQHKKSGLTCSSTCHNPHGTTYNYMLKSYYFPNDGLCLQCHSPVGKFY